MLIELLTDLIETRWLKYIKGQPANFPHQPDPYTCWAWTGKAQRVGSRPHPRAYLGSKDVSPRRVLFSLHHKILDAPPGRLRTNCGDPMCINPLHVEGNIVAIPSPLTPVPPQPQPDLPPPTPEEEVQALEEMRNAIFSRFREFQIKNNSPDTVALLLRCGFTQYVIDTYLADYLTQEKA